MAYFKFKPSIEAETIHEMCGVDDETALVIATAIDKVMHESCDLGILNEGEEIDGEVTSNLELHISETELAQAGAEAVDCELTAELGYYICHVIRVACEHLEDYVTESLKRRQSDDLED